MSEDILDDELLAPPMTGEAFDETSVEDPGTWHFAHGFADSRQAVRVWVEEDSRRLQRLKVSSRWRDRLAGRSLSEAFAEAFFLANIRFGSSPNLEFPQDEQPEVDFAGTFDELAERFAALTDRFNELEGRAPENVRWADFEGERVRCTGAGGRVTVTLSLAGLTESVELDKEWLASAGSAEIAEQVLAVHKLAYARYVPPAFVPGEREELAAEFSFLQAALQSLMSKGIA